MARNYFNLDEVEIDNILMVNLFPKRRERINFSDRKNFENELLPEIIKREGQRQYVANLEMIHKKKRGPKKSSEKQTEEEKENDRLDELYEILNSPPKYLKLAVLITIDSIEE